MRRRSRAGGEPAKSRRGKTVTPKRLNAPEVRGRGAPAPDQDTEIARVTRERDEALEQQKATAEILRVIRTSPADVQPVFETIVRNAVSLCGSLYAHVFRFDGELLHLVASHNVAPSLWRHYADFLKAKYPMRPDSSQVSGRVLLKKSVVRLEDARADPDYDQRSARGGWRRVLGVPMLREGEPLGVIVAGWAEAGPVPKVQEELLKTFADQAVIAIENVRLFAAEQQRSRELSESLRQQTATSEVLGVISRSPGELEPVFQAMLANAVRICDAKFGTLYLRDGDAFRGVATHNAPAAFVEARKRNLVRPAPDSALGQVLNTHQVAQITDITAVKSYIEGDPYLVSAVKLGGYRTVVAVPMLTDNVLIGVIAIYRQEVQPFTDKQIELVKNFAAQAVIAIENARLLNELRQRTDDLTESLEQQTATSEVLRVISSSPGELEPVFQAMLENATRICEAKFGVLNLHENGTLRMGAMHNVPSAFAEWLQNQHGGYRPIPGSPLDHVINTKQLSVAGEAAPGRATTLGGARSTVCVPMIKDDELVGTFTIYRQEVRPFTDKQITLLQNFAAQAVIAIENTRLLNELRQSLEQQTATSEVLRIISASPGELEPVFQAMLENAVRICEAKFGVLHLSEGEGFRVAAMRNAPPAYAELRRREPVMRRPSPRTAIGRAAATKQTVQIADVEAEPGYFDPLPGFSGTQMPALTGARTIVAVPMLKDDSLIGVIIIYRQEVRPFTDKQISLVQNFAAQAVIAIENTRLLNELRESLEQQTATSEVLSVISKSPGALEPVFQAMLENAVRICGAKSGNLALVHDNSMRIAAMYGAPPALEELRRREPTVNPNSPLARILETKAMIIVDDLVAEERYANTAIAKEAGGRTFVGVPMFKENELIGAISIYRQEVRPFTDKQIELLKNFAAQAVIAIENARLLNELRQSLEQQTATAEVLRVISSSPGELQPVFQAMLDNATRICEARFGSMLLRDGGAYRRVALHNAPQSFVEFSNNAPTLRRGMAVPSVDRAIDTRQVVHILDVAAENPNEPIAKFGGARTLLAVPMLKENEPIGVLGIYRQEVRPFTDKQIALVQNFAAQAVIAIENTRLLSELRQSLEQQTATANVLGVISSSPGELTPVFQAILDNATRICKAKFGTLCLQEGNGVRVVALHGAPLAYAEERQRHPVIFPGRTTLLGKALATKRTCQIADIQDEADYALASGSTGAQLAKLGGARTVVAVPMVREDEPVGAILIYRQEVRPFSDKQVELLTNFAAQAVIAIENARLLNELRTRTGELGRSVGELRALGEVSQAVNSTLNLETVLSTIVAKAVQLSGTEAGAIYGYNEQAREFRLRATYGMDQSLIDALTQRHIGLDDPNVREALAQPEPIQVADLKEEAPSDLNEITLRAGFRARLAAPLQSGEDVVGLLVVRRKEPGTFPQNTVDLIKTFAAQSALAIHNARLFHEIEDKSRQLEEASQHKSQFLANMSHELRTPLNAILGYTELMADGAYGEPSEKMMGVLKRLESNGKHLLGLINDVLDLSKIEAGQLVLELSDYSVLDIAQTVRSTLEPLAADKKLAFKLELTPELPPGHGDGRRLTQVLINLVGNAIKFTDAGEVAIKAEANNGSFYVSVRDTGPGISAADQAKLFQEFQQADNAITKKKGGTGLGLAISKRIIEMHGGNIWVESRPGQGSTFAFTLPVIVERQVEVAA